ncbi:erythromycin esterase family protein [Ancylomarina sp. YFZ004]
MKYLYCCIILFLSIFANAQNNENPDIIKLNTISPSDDQFDDLKPLKDIIGEAQVVLLGEPTHGEGNVFEAKTRLVKFLNQEMGFDVLAFESSLYDFNKIDQSISEGDSKVDCLRRCIYPIWAQASEFQGMLKYLVKQNTKLEVTGFDCQLMSEYSQEMLLGDLFIISEKLNSKLNEKELQFLNETLNYLSDSFDVPDTYKLKYLIRLINRFELKLNRLDTDKIINKQPVHLWLQLLFNIKEVATDYHQNHPSRKSREEFKASDNNTRDALMANNLLYFIKHNPNKKIICWGANAHFANQLKALNNEEFSRFVPMGSILKKELGDKKVFIIGSTCASGEYASISEESKTVPTPTKESIEWKLISDSINNAIIRLNKEDGITSSALEYTPLKGKWGNVFDALLFIKETKRCNLYQGDFNYEEELEELNQVVAETVHSKTSSYKSIRQSDIDRTILGKIIMDKNDEPIPYVNIGLKNDAIGTISNEQGDFKLDITNNNLQDTVCFSCIGYKIQYHPIKEFLNASRSEIKMEAQNYDLNEVTISVERLTAKKILRKTIRAIDKNYYQKAYTQDVLFRKKDKYSDSNSEYLLEFVNRTYDSNGYKTRWLDMTSVKEYKQCLATRIATIDSLGRSLNGYKSIKSKRHHYHAYQDLINFRKNSFLNTLKWFRYDFQLSDTLKFNGQSVFRIDFKCKYPSYRSTLQLAALKFHGYLFINMDDYAIVKIESNTINDRNKIWNAEKSEAYKSKDIWFERDVVFYSKQGNYYFMDYAYHHDNWSPISYNERFGFKATLFKSKSFKIPKTSKTVSDDFWSSYVQHHRYKNKYQYQEIKEFSKN